MGFWQKLMHRAAMRALVQMEENENFRFLRTFMFKELESKAFLFLASRIIERCYSRGELICKQGNLGVCMYIIKHGSVEISFSSGGKRVICGKQSGGEMFGQISVLMKSVHLPFQSILENLKLALK